MILLRMRFETFFFLNSYDSQQEAQSDQTIGGRQWDRVLIHRCVLLAVLLKPKSVIFPTARRRFKGAFFPNREKS